VKVLVVGGGGREHALTWALARSPSVDRVVAAPGNPGIAEVARCEPVAADDIRGQVDLARRRAVDLVVVGPEIPLVAGLADALSDRGITALGPSAAGARIEGSKAWAKDLCLRHGIPTGRAEVSDDPARAVALLERFDAPYVIKADGLAAGKGVTVAADRGEAVRAIEACLVDRAFGDAGTPVVIEEHLAGQEVSVLALTDGRTVIPLEPARDFKRAGDGDTGPNTGGMGAYSPVPFVGGELADEIFRTILEPAVRALAAEGIPYRGVLYAGVMVTDDGPRVLEFNARFGDPETQAILPRLDADLGEVLLAAAEDRLHDAKVAWTSDACVAVILASGGYPGPHPTGFPVRGLDRAGNLAKTAIFHAGTAAGDGTVVTAGGRVLTVSALGKDLAEARKHAYRAASLISFEGMHHRTDIAEEAADG
jgi:phosphoribosylamine---glycine ligase